MLARFVRELAHSRFVRNVAVVATGTAGAQALTMALSPIITRLYGPEAFGLLGTFMAMLAVLSPMAALTYPIAIVLPRENAEAEGLAKLSILLAVAMAAMALVLILIWGDSVTHLLRAEAINMYLWLLPLGMLFAALHQVGEQWFIRHRRFDVTARVAVIQSTIINGSKVIVGLLYPLPTVLILLQTVTSGLYAVLFWIGLGDLTRQRLNAREEATPRIIEIARRYRDFPLYRAPEVTVNALSQSIPILLMAGLFGPGAAGFYTLARSILGMPALLLGKSVADVLYPYINEEGHCKEAVYLKLKRLIMLMVVLGIIPFGVIIAFGPTLFSWVFGAEWDKAGEYARWLSISCFCLFLANPLVRVSPIIRAQNIILVFSAVSMISKLIFPYITHNYFDDELVVLVSFVLIDTIFSLMLLAYLLLRFRNGATQA